MVDVRGEARDRGGVVGVADVIALVLTMAGLATAWAIQLFVVPRFAAMYADLGSDAALPPLTQLLAWATAAMVLVAMYLPVFTLAGAISP